MYKLYLVQSKENYKWDQLYGPYDEEEIEIIKKTKKFDERYVIFNLIPANQIDNHKITDSFCCYHKQWNKYYGPFFDMKTSCEWLLSQPECNNYMLYTIICLNRDKINSNYFSG